MTTTYYTLQAGIDNEYTPIVLSAQNNTPVEYRGYASEDDAHDVIADLYSGAKYLSPIVFRREVLRRQYHTAEMEQLLYSHDYSRRGLITYNVYGADRSISSDNALPLSEAIYVAVDKETHGYRTYVCVPYDLDSDAMEEHHLIFISRSAVL